MCGRYSFSKLSTEVEKRFKIQIDGNTYVARYNCTPGQNLGIISNAEPHKLQLAKWGLIPSWAKDSKTAFINARAESLDEKPAFKDAFKTKACLIPADGFYEWKPGDKNKIPYHICLKSREIFSFAGLWSEWENPENGKLIRSFTIITTQANKLIQSIHQRMPVILPHHLEKEWLENTNKKDLQKMLQAYDGAKMEVYEVSRHINNIDSKGAKLIEPYNNPKQLNLFGK